MSEFVLLAFLQCPHRIYVLPPQHALYTDESIVMICGGSDSGGNTLDNCMSIQPEATNPTWVIERRVRRYFLRLTIE